MISQIFLMLACSFATVDSNESCELTIVNSTNCDYEIRFHFMDGDDYRHPITVGRAGSTTENVCATPPPFQQGIYRVYIVDKRCSKFHPPNTLDLQRAIQQNNGHAKFRISPEVYFEIQPVKEQRRVIRQVTDVVCEPEYVWTRYCGIQAVCSQKLVVRNVPVCETVCTQRKVQKVRPQLMMEYEGNFISLDEVAKRMATPEIKIQISQK